LDSTSPILHEETGKTVYNYVFQQVTTIPNVDLHFLLWQPKQCSAYEEKNKKINEK
jgi:hypothetical protein